MVLLWTVVLAETVQPLAPVAVTEYVPLAVTDSVVAVVPSDQTRPVPDEVAVKVTLGMVQVSSVLDALIETVGGAWSALTLAEAVAVQPLTSVTVTEYVPAVVTTNLSVPDGVPPPLNV